MLYGTGFVACLSHIYTPFVRFESQVRAAPQADDCVRHCGGLLRVLAAVRLDLSLAIDPPAFADAFVQPQQPGRRAAGAATAALAPASASQAVQTAVAAGTATAAMTDAIQFPLRHYDRVRSTLQTNKQLGLALLEGYDQIPHPTLDVYRREGTHPVKHTFNPLILLADIDASAYRYGGCSALILSNRVVPGA